MDVTDDAGTSHPNPSDISYASQYGAESTFRSCPGGQIFFVPDLVHLWIV